LNTAVEFSIPAQKNEARPGKKIEKGDDKRVEPDLRNE
jgi:hypothetical protein